MPWVKVPHYLVAQYLGGFVGTAFAYWNHATALTVFDGGVRSAFFNETSTGGILTTHPTEHLTIAGSLFDQV